MKNKRTAYLVAAGILAGLVASYTAWNTEAVVEILGAVVDALAPAAD